MSAILVKAADHALDERIDLLERRRRR